MNQTREVVAVLAYQGKEYTVMGESSAEDDGILYHWTDGNYGCDCNRSLFIGDIDENFPYLDCGETIELRSLAVDGKALLP